MEENSPDSRNHAANAAFSQSPEAIDPRPRLRSVDLFGSAREILIEHAGEYYRLRLTRQGKLLLTK